MILGLVMLIVAFLWYLIQKIKPEKQQKYFWIISNIICNSILLEWDLDGLFQDMLHGLILL